MAGGGDASAADETGVNAKRKPSKRAATAVTAMMETFIARAKEDSWS